MTPRSLLSRRRRDNNGLRTNRPWSFLPSFSIQPLLLLFVSAFALQGAGGRRLRGFLAAPPSVQEAFMRRVRAQAEAEREFAEWEREQQRPRYDIRTDASWTLDEPGLPRLVTGPVAPSPEVGPRLSQHEVQWDEHWDRRAYRVREGLDSGTVPRLKEIPTTEYVTALTGEDASKPIPCPLPDHDDRTASFWSYDDSLRWWCFGCNRGGNIFDLAGHLWGIEPSGLGFRQLRERLEQVFA